jgi:hypothetical protein
MTMNTIQFDTTTPIASAHQPSDAFSGLLSSLVAGPVQTWGRLEVVGLFRANGRAERSRYNSPLESLNWFACLTTARWSCKVLRPRD